MSALSGSGLTGSFGRTRAMLIKEFIQLRRDRVSFAMIVMMPLMQLLLFGYAINTTPRDLPTAVLLQENSDLGRSILEGAGEHQILQGHAAGARRGRIRPRAGRGRGAVRHRNPAQLRARACAAANARRSWSRPTRPIRWRPARRSRRWASWCRPRLRTTAACPTPARRCSRSAPTRATIRRPRPQLNIVPGLVGTILTMTMLIFTALSVTREIERGTMESLLSMPITPVEIMIGKIIPYVIVGFVQASLIIGIGIGLFGVPVLGSLTLLAALSTLFIATNLSVGYTFSTIAQNQLQAMQMSMMFFLPNILLSGFMFPFAGMPHWAQWIGECLPLTHYLRIVRAIMLKGATLGDLHYDTLALVGLMLVAMAIAVTRFRRTLD